MLRHSSDTEPGITRKRIGRAWGYFDARGKRITDRDEIDRLNAVGLPPAYTDAWFCADANGHLQATGIDARGRKQYRYHADFRAKRDTAKHGIVHEVKITDSNLKRICKRCQDLPGQMLFQYVNGDGEPKPITSGDVNHYIREATGGDFTAKDFRTWGATVIAFNELLKK